MNDLNFMDWLALVIVILGALNWALVGAFKFNLIDSIFGEDSGLTRLIYIIVGLAGVYVIFLSGQLQKT